MKHRLAIVATVATVAALAASALALGSPAEAKGMSGVVITGAGLDRPIVVDFRSDGSALERLMVAAPLFGEGSGAPVADPAELGPLLRLTWSVEWKTTQHVIQDVYPYAPRGPVFHTPAGQQIFDQRTTAQWYQGGADVLATLRTVGVPPAGELRAARAVMAFAGSSHVVGIAIRRW